MPRRCKFASVEEELMAWFEREFCAGTGRIQCNPSVEQLVWQVTTTAIDIPKELCKYHIRAFEGSPREIWTRNRGAVRRICALDRMAGGNPWPFPHRYRRCAYCGRHMLGTGAWYRRIQEAFAWLRGVPVERCSSECIGPRTPENPKSLGKSRVCPFSQALNGCRACSHGGRDTVEKYDRLDVRILRRQGCLTTGSRFSFGPIRGRNAGTRLVLSLGTQRRRCTIRLLRTRCNYGGVRKWLQCPVAGCGQRVGILYLRGKSLGCRGCLGLGYCSQREETGTRRLRRARQIRAGLGLSADLSLPLVKPLRMRLRTYERLEQHYRQLVQRALGLDGLDHLDP